MVGRPLCQWCDEATATVGLTSGSHELNVCDDCADLMGQLLLILAHDIDGGALAEWVDNYKADRATRP